MGLLTDFNMPRRVLRPRKTVKTRVDPLEEEDWLGDDPPGEWVPRQIILQARGTRTEIHYQTLGRIYRAPLGEVRKFEKVNPHSWFGWVKVPLEGLRRNN